MQIRLLDTLTYDEVRALARQAAENGEGIDSANPYPSGPRRVVFTVAFARHAVDLQLDESPSLKHA